MANSSTGYIFAVHNPFAEDPERDIIYVARSEHPEETLGRMLGSTTGVFNDEWNEWLVELQEKAPGGLLVHPLEMVEKVYFNDLDHLPELITRSGQVVIPWTILAYEQPIEDQQEQVEGISGVKMTLIKTRSLKSQWISKLRQAGHPLMNKTPGRKKGSKLYVKDDGSRGVVQPSE